MTESASKAGGWLTQRGDIPESGFVSGAVNDFLLRVLLKLNDLFPERTNLLDCKNISANITDFMRYWNWLEREGVVSGPIENCSLTIPGKKSFQFSLNEEPELASILKNSECILSDHQANILMLTTLRQHYSSYIERTRAKSGF